MAYEVESKNLLLPESFLNIYFTNCLENLKRSPKGRRWCNALKDYFMYLKFLSNKRVINSLHANNLCVSERKLRERRLPIELNKIWTHIINIEGNSELLKNKKLFLAFDEIIIKRHVDLNGDEILGMENVMTIEEFQQAFDTFDTDLNMCDKIMQFFLIDSTNTVCIPIGAFTKATTQM